MTIRSAIVVGEFNRAVCDRLLQGALTRFRHYKLPVEGMPVVRVPGAIEIPYAVQLLLEQKRFDVVIALGAVIRGETGHYDSVCRQVDYGCQRLILDYRVPVIFGILMTDNVEQAYARSGGDHSDKGAEAVDTAMYMTRLKERL